MAEALTPLLSELGHSAYIAKPPMWSRWQVRTAMVLYADWVTDRIEEIVEGFRAGWRARKEFERRNGR